jgi:hypothetical protein
VYANEPGTVVSAKAVSAKVILPSEAPRSTSAKLDELEKGKLSAGMVAAESTMEFGDCTVLHLNVATLLE